MKLLPKQQVVDIIQKQKVQDAKEGLALAKKVDFLRDLKSREEQNLKEWRDANIQKVQQEIDSYIEVKNNLRIVTEKAESYSRELMKPLDKEWADLKAAKAEMEKQQAEFNSLKDLLEVERQNVFEEKLKISKIVSQVTQNEKETRKSKEESAGLRDMAQREYEIARGEHSDQTNLHEKAMSKVRELQETYQNGLNIIEREEKEVKEKEEELIIREEHLAQQQANMRTAWEVIKQKQ